MCCNFYIILEFQPTMRENFEPLVIVDIVFVFVFLLVLYECTQTVLSYKQRQEHTTDFTLEFERR